MWFTTAQNMYILTLFPLSFIINKKILGKKIRGRMLLDLFHELPHLIGLMFTLQCMFKHF